MNLHVTLYEKPKYELENKVLTDFYYENIQSYEVISGGEKLLCIEKMISSECFDKYCHYLLITLENGYTVTYRYSFVDVEEFFLVNTRGRIDSPSYYLFSIFNPFFIFLTEIRNKFIFL